MIKKSKSILDFGCGRGQCIDRLKEQGFNARGYDPNNPILNTMPVNCFDIVMCNYVLDVVPTTAQEQIIKTVLSKVYNGGKAIFSYAVKIG